MGVNQEMVTTVNICALLITHVHVLVYCFLFILWIMETSYNKARYCTQECRQYMYLLQLIFHFS